MTMSPPLETTSQAIADETGPSPAGMPEGQPLLRVRDLRTWFPVKRGLLRRVVGHLKAVDGVSLDVHPRETVGLVGESGCGKSTVGRTILRLIGRGQARVSGQVHYEGGDVFAAGRQELRALRRRMQIIFQDPVGSLNPRMTVGRIIGEPLVVHERLRGRALQEEVNRLLELVGLQPSHAQRYPHEFSGGQRQRIGIARALALKPRFIVCDEPVSALDVSIQSQILNLLKELQQQQQLSYLFIAHNLAVIEHFCDRIAVMYLGRIVEQAGRDDLYRNPRHPYTRALLSAAPHPATIRGKRRIILPGEVPSPLNPPSGCAFHVRCPLTRECAAQSSESETVQITINRAGDQARIMRRCKEQEPALEPVDGDGRHTVSCFYHDRQSAYTQFAS